MAQNLPKIYSMDVCVCVFHINREKTNISHIKENDGSLKGILTLLSENKIHSFK